MAKGNKKPAQGWQPGQSGNPKGRPKKVTLTKVLNELMDSSEISMDVTTTLPGKEHDDPPEIVVKSYNISSSKNMKYAVNMALIAKAIKGDIYAISLIFDRLEGKAVQTNIIAPTEEFKLLSNADKKAELKRLLFRVA